MKKEGGIFSGNFAGDNISAINHLIKILERHLERFEKAYERKDSKEFNILKREILQLQRKIHSLII
jgi:hypothetical protein